MLRVLYSADSNVYVRLFEAILADDTTPAIECTTTSASDNGVPVPSSILGINRWVEQWLLGHDYVQRGFNAAYMSAGLKSAQHASTVLALHESDSRELPAISHSKTTKK